MRVENKNLLLLLFLHIPFGAAWAQNIPPSEQPGRLEQRFAEPSKPLSKPVIRKGLESTVPPEVAAKIKVKINRIVISGNSVFSSDDLLENYKSLYGRVVSLKRIFDIAAHITKKYGQAGYALSRAIVPPQSLDPKGAVIRIRVLEGYIDKVKWPYERLKRYRNFFENYARAITSERPIRVQTLERYLLLANDLPGLKFSSTLRASKYNSLASTLVLKLEEEKNVHFSFTLDNRGTKGSGPVQPSVSGSLKNAFGLHEAISLGYVAAGPNSRGRLRPEMSYLFFGYRQKLNSEGMEFEISGSNSFNKPDTDQLRQIQYKGKALSLSFAFHYPVIRTRPQNLRASLFFNLKNSKAYQLGALSSHDRLRYFQAQLSYDLADEIGGINQVVISASKGLKGLGSTKNGNPLASRANGKVDFFKMEVDASRRQRIYDNIELFVALHGQWTKNPLLSSQECGFGGAQFGRAYDASALTGDRCILLLGELRYNLNLENVAWNQIFDYLQLYGFSDYGKIWNIHQPAGTPKSDRGSSFGLGARFGGSLYALDLQLTRHMKRPITFNQKRGWRVFFKFSTSF